MQSQQKKLIVMGDSGVYGWGDIEKGGWCERLRQKWLKENNGAVIYPLGIRGDGLEKLAKRCKLEWECRGETRRTVPDSLLINIGLNDTARVGRKDGRPQLSSDAFRYGLERLISDMRNKTQVIMMGLTPVKEEMMPFAGCLWYSNEACSLYERQIEEACLEQDIPFIPLHKEMSAGQKDNELIGIDGIHLNTKGHCWVFEKISFWLSTHSSIFD